LLVYEKVNSLRIKPVFAKIRRTLRILTIVYPAALPQKRNLSLLAYGKVTDAIKSQYLQVPITKTTVFQNILKTTFLGVKNER
jgi:hypothetical protein